MKKQVLIFIIILLSSMNVFSQEKKEKGILEFKTGMNIDEIFKVRSEKYPNSTYERTELRKNQFTVIGYTIKINLSAYYSAVGIIRIELYFINKIDRVYQIIADLGTHDSNIFFRQIEKLQKEYGPPTSDSVDNAVGRYMTWIFDENLSMKIGNNKLLGILYIIENKKWKTIENNPPNDIPIPR